jgi:TRAP-type mannitol/chloroaromatic compound transport system substrate-binding protein
MNRRDLFKGAVLAAAVATASHSYAAELPEINWRLQSAVPPGIGFFKGGETFAKEVEAMTNGKFKIRVFPAGEIVGTGQIFDAVSDGTVEAGHTASYYYWGKSPAFALDTTIPFGLNYRQFQAWWNYGNGKALLQELFAKHNIVNLPAGNTGVQMGGWFRNEIKSLDDLQGLKMRIGGMGGRIIEKLGVVPQTIPGGDILPSLEKGTIDAAEWVGPFDDLTFGFNKVADYYYTPGWWEAAPNLSVYINKEKYDALPVEYQNIIIAAAERANVDTTAFYDAKNPDALKTLLASGTKLKRYPKEIMDAAWDAAQETYAELREENEDFKRIYDDMLEFQKAQNQWMGVAEGLQDSYMQSKLR